MKHDEFVTLEQGQASGYDVLPPSIASKSESERTESETKRVRGLEEMKADIKKPAAERKHGSPFLERHEKIKPKEGPPAKKQKT